MINLTSVDVYDNSPTVVTVWLTIMPKISIFLLLLELHSHIGLIGGLTNISLSTTGYTEIFQTLSGAISDFSSNTLSFLPVIPSLLSVSLLPGINVSSDSLIYILKNLFLISSLLSLIIGTVVGLAQVRIKRLLAYSTISHIGFMLLSLGINTEQSIDSLIFYIIQYSLTNLNLFFILIALSYIFNKSVVNSLHRKIFLSNFSHDKGDFVLKDLKYLSDLKGQYLENPFLSLGLTICLFSMAGVPPLMGFFSKQYVLYSAVQSGYNFMAIVAIVVSVISASYYLKIIKILHSPSDNLFEDDQGLEIDPNNLISLPIVENTVKDAGNDIVQEDAVKKLGDSKILLLWEEDTPVLTNLHVLFLSILTLLIFNKKVGGKKEVVYWEDFSPILTNLHSLLISILTLLILFFVLKPSIILNSTKLLSLSLFYF